jgi:hypothetical protein
MFVIMLAQQAPNPDMPEAEAEYDVNPREPGMACGVGFILLAVLANMVCGGVPALPLASAPEAQKRAWQSLNLMPRDVEAIVERQMPGAKPTPRAKVIVTEGGPYITVRREGEAFDTRLPLPPESIPGNVQQVGLDLVAKFPVSLELAGVILLMAMFGAVVLARKQIELGEDEIREAAGMRRLGFHAEEPGESRGEQGGVR